MPRGQHRPALEIRRLFGPEASNAAGLTVPVIDVVRRLASGQSPYR